MDIFLEERHCVTDDSSSFIQRDPHLSRKSIDADSVRGPRMLASGACIVMTGGHNRFIGIEVDGVDEARRAARLQLKLGADLFKVVSTGGVITAGVEPEPDQLSIEEMKAAVDEAASAHAAQRILDDPPPKKWTGLSCF